MNWQKHPPRDENFEQRIMQSFSDQGYMSFIGAELDLVAHGKVNINLPKNSNLNQQHGFFHGGVITSIADSAAGFAALTTFDADCGILTSELKINFLNPAAGKYLVAKGRVIRPGKTITVCQADVFNDDNTHIATALLTMVRVENLKN